MIFCIWIFLKILILFPSNSSQKWNRDTRTFLSDSREEASVRALSSHSSIRTNGLYVNHTVITLTWRNVTGMDCDFEKEEKCNWTWDEDSYEEGKASSSKPGQHGFFRLNGRQVKDFHNKFKSDYYGPRVDKSGSTEGTFLYLLGKPLSDAEEISDKRLLSALLAESGNQCTVEITVFFQDIEGAHIIVGIENVDNAYTPYRSFVMGQQNDTTHGRWKELKVKIGRNISPFRIFIEIRRHKASLAKSFIALDKIRLLRCAPEDSGPINCSNSVDPPYTCPGGDGISCLNAPSTLCDLKNDCPRGEDELEPSCGKMPLGARCDFENFCGWIDPYESSRMQHQNSKPTSPRWILKSGPAHLEGGIKGDLSGTPNGKYLYYHYKREANTGLPKSVDLISPPFPPPPKYNSNPGKLFQSCRIRFSYHRQIKGTMPGPIDIFIQWIDDNSKDNGYHKQKAFKVAVPSPADKNMGWIRWEAKLPTSPQLRYQIVLSGMGSIGGAEMELAIDDFSLSPHCFGYEVHQSKLQGWRYNMTDLEFCKYYGRKSCPVPKKLPGFIFTTCGKKLGAFGPKKQDCDKFYKSSKTEVQVSGESQIGFTTGIQRWRPPKSGIYTIIAKGASGAVGRSNKVQSSADEIRVVVSLKANETLFILVGQMGQAFCEATGLTGQGGRCSGGGGKWSSKRRRETSYSEGSDDSSLDQIREHMLDNEDDPILRNHSYPNSQRRKKDPFDNIHNDSYKGIGGGGGGGATIIFKFVERLGAVPILIAAGGGGSSDLRSDIISDAQGLLNPWVNLNEHLALVPMVKTDAGSGAGWNETFSPPMNYNLTLDEYEKETIKNTPHGFSLQHGWFGGLPCSKDDQFGGFGGGGAGCRGGGGGGGFIGGMGGNDNNQNGRGGFSYVNMDEVIMVLGSETSTSSSGGYMSKSNRNWQGFKTWKHIGVGQAQIIPSIVENPCNCTDDSAACISLDEEKARMKCVCRNGIFLSHIHPKCSTDIPIIWKIGIIIASLIALAIFGLLSMILYSQFQRKHDIMLRRKILSGPDSQLNRLRNMNGNGGGIMLTEYNPNYEFGGGSCSLQDLKEIPRENLRLVKALGQGAFGEVYQGSYKNSNDSCEVAVKTLPELSSTQAEMDFLMEALIMSKFNHPNIVYFIGVCFDKHPRYIVLELLAGGDLKTFLRESRPKPDRSSPLVMKDLLTCAMDVAKGCEYLEDNHFIHRDIAARNCLLTTKGPSRIVKIADFGMARDIYRADYYRKGGKTMLPVKWMPPEAFLDGIFTSKTDIWSFGILLWEVMSLGYMPYPGRGNQEVMQLVTNGGRLEPPNYCPGPVYGLMCQCWHPIPEERPNFRTILERLGYCMQDPEVVMAPLPMFHRPLSLDSRDTSISSGRQLDTSLDSGDRGGSFPPSSFPTRSSTASTTLLNHKHSNSSTPDSPLGPSSPSADYLVPLVAPSKKSLYAINNGEEELVRETSFIIMDSSSSRQSSKTSSPPSALDAGALRSKQMATPKSKYSNVQAAASAAGGRPPAQRNPEALSNEISV